MSQPPTMSPSAATEAAFASAVAREVKGSMIWHLLFGGLGLLVTVACLGAAVFMGLMGSQLMDEGMGGSAHPISPALFIPLVVGLYLLAGFLYAAFSILLLWSGVKSAGIGKPEQPSRAHILSALRARRWLWHSIGAGVILTLLSYAVMIAFMFASMASQT